MPTDHPRLDLLDDPAVSVARIVGRLREPLAQLILTADRGAEMLDSNDPEELRAALDRVLWATVAVHDALT